MPNWLIDDPTPVYLLLGIVALGLLVALWRTQQRKYALALGVVPVLACLVGLLDYAVESDREQIERKVREMAEAVHARNTERISSHISNDFAMGALNKAKFREVVDKHINSGEVQRVAVWNFDPAQVTRPPGGGKGTATVEFYVKGVGAKGEVYYLCRAAFVLDLDGQWRMKGFELFDPVNTKQPVAIPGLPY